jgi:ABC-type multidrug transport system ATPase subunit
MNNLVCCGDDTDETQRTLFKNLVASVQQTDDHAPRYTVGETFEFSNLCKFPVTSEHKRASELVELVLEGLGLSHVKDTFVGNEKIRGVSGGELFLDAHASELLCTMMCEIIFSNHHISFII